MFGQNFSDYARGKLVRVPMGLAAFPEPQGVGQSSGKAGAIDRD